MKFMLRTALFYAALIFVAAPEVRAESYWVQANGQSCERACKKAGHDPITTGKFSNGKNFYVCAAEGVGAGRRPGYNLAPDWDDVCMIGIGGKEVRASRYLCACD